MEYVQLAHGICANGTWNMSKWHTEYRHFNEIPHQVEIGPIMSYQIGTHLNKMGTNNDLEYQRKKTK